MSCAKCKFCDNARRIAARLLVLRSMRNIASGLRHAIQVTVAYSEQSENIPVFQAGAVSSFILHLRKYSCSVERNLARFQSLCYQCELSNV